MQPITTNRLTALHAAAILCLMYLILGTNPGDYPATNHLPDMLRWAAGNPLEPLALSVPLACLGVDMGVILLFLRRRTAFTRA